MANWLNITQDPIILQIVQGFQIQFQSFPVQRTLPLPSLQNCKLVGEEIETLRKGAIQRVPFSEQGFYHRMFLVAKKGGGQRPVLDLSPLNKFIQTEHFKMENLMTIKSLITKGDYMINIDLTDAYLTVPIHPSSQKFLRFLWQGQSYQFVTMPFGLNVAPRVFTKLMKPVTSWLRGQGVRMIIFLDDILVLAPTIETLNQHARMTISLLESLGFLINYQKSTLVPTQRILFLGMLIDSSTMEFVLPKDKKENILRECRYLLRTKQPSIRQISRVLGLLEFTRPAIWAAPLHYRHLQLLQIESLHRSSDYNTQVSLSKDAKLDVNWWITNLPSLGGSPILPLTADLTISSDASKIGWGAAWGNRRTGGRWNVHEAQDHINILELKAAFFALKSLMKDQSHKVICLKIDNSIAVAYLNNKGGTHSPQLLQLTLEIWNWCKTKHLYIIAQHVPGKKNVVADEESRKMIDHNDWQLNPTIIQPLIKGCQIDLFASRLTRQLKSYVSWRPDLRAIHVDAFTMDWRNLRAYAFPPFNLIAAVLHKTRREMATLVLIAPLWSAQPWWPLLMDLVIDYPVYLGNNPNLLTDVSHPKAVHPLFPALKLAVWTISGDSSKQQAFQLSTCSPTALRPRPPKHITVPGLSGVAGVKNERVIPHLVQSPRS